MTKQEIEARNKCDRFMCRGAKLGNNNAIYGYYSSVGSEYYIEAKSRKKHCVHKSTLSQCIGEKDSKGVMVFEKDLSRNGDKVAVIIKVLFFWKKSKSLTSNTIEID